MTDTIENIKSCINMVSRLSEIENNSDNTESHNLLGELSNCLANIEHDNISLKEQLVSLQSELVTVKDSLRWPYRNEEPIETKDGYYLFKDDPRRYCSTCWNKFFRLKIALIHPKSRCQVCQSENELECKIVTLRAKLSLLEIENTKLKAKVDKGFDIEKPNGIKWNCYLFDNDDALYCSTCWDFKVSKSKTVRFNKSDCRICPVCNPNHPVFKKIEPNFENVTGISFSMIPSSEYSELGEEVTHHFSITKKGLLEYTRVSQKESYHKDFNVTEGETHHRVFREQLSDVQMVKIAELLYKINLKALEQLSYFDNWTPPCNHYLNISFDTNDNTKILHLSISDGISSDDEFINIVKYTDIITSASYYKRLLEIEGEAVEYEVMVETFKAYKELRKCFNSLIDIQLISLFKNSLFKNHYPKILDVFIGRLKIDFTMRFRAAMANNILPYSSWNWDSRYNPEANNIYERLLQIAPDSQNVNYNYGVFLASTEKLKESIGYLEKALSLGSTNVERSFAEYSLGMVYVNLGDKSKALQYLERFKKRWSVNINFSKLIDSLKNEKTDEI